MAVKGILRAISSNASHDASPAPVPDGLTQRVEILDDIERSGINWLWATDAENRLIYLSASAADSVDKPIDELLSLPLTDLIADDPDNPEQKSDRPLNFQLSKRSKIDSLVVGLKPQMLERQDQPIWWMINAHPKFDEAGDFQGYRGNAKDVTIEYQRKVEDSRLAQFDSLTGLANRHRMNHRLNALLSAFKTTNRSCAIMMLDLDRFKYINDTMGHLAGDELIRSSDLALYSAKNSGRGQYRFYSVELKNAEEDRRLMVDNLRDALVNDQLELRYQPVVRLEDNLVVGFEALMRWMHPTRGLISPDVFIPIAEELNQINQLGEWALRQACHDAIKWPNSVRISVNVSAVQFADRKFPEIVLNALVQSGLEPDRLELELTESVFLGDSETTDNTFKILKDLGVRLALDDFGTGYSSLSYLQSAPFDKIKVDKSFVDSCTQEDENSAKIIAAIIGLSDALGMETTVEGVEAFDQFNLVRSKGAKYIQGWIYSKALKLEQIEKKMGSGEFKIAPDGPELHRPDRRTVFRRIGAIHEDHRYDVVMRDLSKTGARFEGIIGVPVGTNLVLDLGEGQLVVSSVIRSQESTIAVQFETPLISDGAGGLCTRHRISPYELAAAGMPLAALPKGRYPLANAASSGKNPPQFTQVSLGKN